MKPRWSILFALALICALILPGAVSADTSAPPAPAYAGAPTGQPAPAPPTPPQALSGEESKHFGRALDTPAALSPDLMLGQPGLSFRYDRTLGEAEAAYLEDDDHFYDVEGIGTDGANVWVTDSWGSRVVKFNDAGGFLQKIGKAGFRDSSGASLDYLTDVAVDSGGNIWVVDGGANHVVKYDSTGKVLSELGQAWSAGSDNAHFNSPISIAFDAAGNVYVSDSGLWGEYGNHRVQVFDSSGNYRATIGQTGVTGSDNNHLNQPRHIAVFGNQLYVADAGNQRVQIFNISNPAAPAYAATLGLTGAAGSDNAHLDSPEGVAVDANFIYVADANNQRVQVLNRTTRTYVATIGAGTYGTDNNHFNHPTDVAIDTTGNIYVADNWNKRVQQYQRGSGLQAHLRHDRRLVRHRCLSLLLPERRGRREGWEHLHNRGARPPAGEARCQWGRAVVGGPAGTIRKRCRTSLLDPGRCRRHTGTRLLDPKRVRHPGADIQFRRCA